MPPKRKKSIEKKPIPEDFELSDDEPTTVNLNEEQRVSSKFISFDCPLCKVASQRADVTLFWKSPSGEPESRFVVDRARF